MAVRSKAPFPHLLICLSFFERIKFPSQEQVRNKNVKQHDQVSSVAVQD